MKFFSISTLALGFAIGALMVGDVSAQDNALDRLGKNGLDGIRSNAIRSRSANALGQGENALSSNGNALEGVNNGLTRRANPLDGQNGLVSLGSEAFSTLNTNALNNGRGGISEVPLSEDIDFIYSPYAIGQQEGGASSNKLNPQNSLTPENSLSPQNSLSAPQNALSAQNSLNPVNSLAPENNLNPTNTLSPENTLSPQNTLEPTNTLTPENTLVPKNALAGRAGSTMEQREGMPSLNGIGSDSRFVNRLTEINSAQGDEWRKTPSAFDGELRITPERRNVLGGKSAFQ